jgi:hypothetical protein
LRANRRNIASSDHPLTDTHSWRRWRIACISQALLPVANGGTGSNTQNFVDLSTPQTVGGAKTFTDAATFGSTVSFSSKVTFGVHAGLAASTPIAYAGSAYPRSGNFTTSGGTVIVMATGSAYLGGGGTMQVDILVDNVVRGSLFGFTNEASSHKALVGNDLVLTGLAAGTHTVQLKLTAGFSDYNDYSQVSVLELPL